MPSRIRQVREFEAYLLERVWRPHEDHGIQALTSPTGRLPDCRVGLGTRRLAAEIDFIGRAERRVQAGRLMRPALRIGGRVEDELWFEMRAEYRRASGIDLAWRRLAECHPCDGVKDAADGEQSSHDQTGSRGWRKSVMLARSTFSPFRRTVKLHLTRTQPHSTRAGGRRLATFSACREYE